jgi:hypothetical protein
MAAVLTKMDAPLRLARKGPVRSRDLDGAGIPRAYLSRLCERGLLEQVGRGLYRLAEAPVTELSPLADVSKRVPHAVLCLARAIRATFERRKTSLPATTPVALTGAFADVRQSKPNGRASFAKPASATPAVSATPSRW